MKCYRQTYISMRWDKSGSWPSAPDWLATFPIMPAILRTNT